MKVNNIKKNVDAIKIYLAYVVLFSAFVFKLFFYANEDFSTPDSSAHISYIVYMEENEDKLIPQFENIYMYTRVALEEENGETIAVLEKGGLKCYLGHPPLYYKIMQMCDTVQIDENGTAYVNYSKLRNLNIFMSSITMLIVLMAGYNLIKKNGNSWKIHFLYTAICTTLPLYGYVGSGINNDNLCNLGVVIFWIGLLNYVERGYSYKTFWLVSLGIFVSMFAKLTTGLIVVVATLLMIIVDIIKTKKASIVFNKFFASTIPVYIIVLAYFIYIYINYGAFQPSYDIIASQEEFQASPFFVAETERIQLTLWEDVKWFFSGLWRTWVATYTTGFMVERKGIEAIGYVIILFLFCVAIIKEIYVYVKKCPEYNDVISMAFGLSIIAVIIIHCCQHYQGYLSRGYIGGYQARYYMPCIPIIAVGACESINYLRKRCKIWMTYLVDVMTIALACLLIYSDFIYFVIEVYSMNY